MSDLCHTKSVVTSNGSEQLSDVSRWRDLTSELCIYFPSSSEIRNQASRTSTASKMLLIIIPVWGRHIHASNNTIAYTWVQWCRGVRMKHFYIKIQIQIPIIQIQIRFESKLNTRFWIQNWIKLDHRNPKTIPVSLFRFQYPKLYCHSNRNLIYQITSIKFWILDIIFKSKFIQNILIWFQTLTLI